MAASDASQPAAGPERRFAENGRPYTKEQFMHYYKSAGEFRWKEAEARRPPTDGSAAQPPAEDVIANQQDTNQQEDAMGSTEGSPADRGAAIPAISEVPAVLLPQHVVAIQNAEAARGPPRSLHKIARNALNAISNSANRSPVNLDGVFPWMQYVAAHPQSADIIGTGITRAHAVFLPGTNDPNRGGAPRLDFCFYRTDGTFCRVHPGRRPKEDAQLRIESL